MTSQGSHYLGIPRHSVSWKLLWIFYTMLAVIVVLLLSFTRPLDTVIATTTISPDNVKSTVYGVIWWKYAVNLVVLSVVLIGIPYSLRYFVRHMYRKNGLGNGSTGAVTK